MTFKNDLIVPHKQYGITIIGEILVDEIYNRSTGETSMMFGGSPANITMNMTELGNKGVHFFGTVGKDYYGENLLKDLQKKHIDTSHIDSIEDSTTIVRINKTELTPIPSFYRSADYKIEYSDELEEKIKNSSLLHFSYWPLSMEPAKSTVLKALKIAKQSDTIVGFDPNYHEALITNESVQIKDLVKIFHYVDIIKPSLDDSIRIFGVGHTIEEYLQKYIDCGIKLVVMTLGKDGLIAHYKDHIYRLPSFATKVVDATGAGDAFISGLYTGLLSGETIETSLKLGSACSAYNLSQIGGNSNLPPVEELKKEFNV